MSDMQTALTKALEEGKRRFMTATLNDWDKHEQQIRQQPQFQPQPQPETPTENVMLMAYQNRNLTRDLFDFIKQSDCTPMEAVKEMERQGYNPRSASSLITQMKRAGMIRLQGNHLRTCIDEYKALGSVYRRLKVQREVAKAKREAAKAKAKPTKPTTHGIAALTAATTPIVHAAPVAAQWDAETVIANIGIKEAYKLYEELSKYFGNKG